MDSDENLYIYTLVEFIARGRKPAMKQIDLVPTFWGGGGLDYNSQIKKYQTKFLGPPYKTENIHQLRDLVQNLGPPSEDWPLYSVIIKGRASKYSFSL